MKDEVQIIPAVNQEIIKESGVSTLLEQIRPEWKTKNLIQRVEKILPIDPSSACQRIFNAAIHDLREKIIIAGLDIATEVAEQSHLPPIKKSEDVERYSVSNIINLAYGMGLLSRPEYRRILRVYDIRCDLEHEDNEYEATIEDCLYTFKTSIEVVLSKDPVQLLKLTDIKNIVEEADPITLTETLINDYKFAPQSRQLKIYQFLINTALNNKHPDIVRQNSYIALKTIQNITLRPVIIDCAKEFINRFKRKAPNLSEVRVAYIAGILPYLKKSVINDFFKSYLELMNKTGFSFRSNAEHGELLRNLTELGGLNHCPQELLQEMIEWLIQCYIGERSFGLYSDWRKVFYSNIGAPLSLEILKAYQKDISELITKIKKTNQQIRYLCDNKYVERRYQKILDALNQ